MDEPLVSAAAPIRVVAVTTRGGPRLRYLLEEDPNRGTAYEIVGGVANDDDGRASETFDAHDVPVTVRDIYDFYDGRGAELQDLSVREEFDDRLAREVAAFDPDLVVLSGYLHVVTTPFLDRFFPRVLNAHHADLTVRDASGAPVYTGLEAVSDAIRAGEASTRESVHVVTEEVDTGPLVARSRPYPVNTDLVEDALARGDERTLEAYVDAHRRWMITEAGGPTLAKAIELAAEDRVAYRGGETYVDGKPGFYQLGAGVRATSLKSVGDDA